MIVYLALHEERYPCAVFSTREAAVEWIKQQDQRDHTFTVEKLALDDPAYDDSGYNPRRF